MLSFVVTEPRDIVFPPMAILRLPPVIACPAKLPTATFHCPETPGIARYPIATLEMATVEPYIAPEPTDVFLFAVVRLCRAEFPIPVLLIPLGFGAIPRNRLEAPPRAFSWMADPIVRVCVPGVKVRPAFCVTTPEDATYGNAPTVVRLFPPKTAVLVPLVNEVAVMVPFIANVLTGLVVPMPTLPLTIKFPVPASVVEA